MRESRESSTKVDLLLLVKPEPAPEEAVLLLLLSFWILAVRVRSVKASDTGRPPDRCITSTNGLADDASTGLVVICNGLPTMSSDSTDSYADAPSTLMAKLPRPLACPSVTFPASARSATRTLAITVTSFPVTSFLSVLDVSTVTPKFACPLAGAVIRLCSRVG